MGMPRPDADSIQSWLQDINDTLKEQVKATDRLIRATLIQAQLTNRQVHKEEGKSLLDNLTYVHLKRRIEDLEDKLAH